MLSQENNVERSQSNILIDSKIPSQKAALRTFGRKVSFTCFELSVFKLSQTVSSGLVRSIDLASINPWSQDIDISSDLSSRMYGSSHLQLLSPSAFLVHKTVTFGNFDIHWLVSGCWR